MKKVIFFVGFLLVLQATCGVVVVSSQENKEFIEIEKVLGVYLENLNNADIGSLMQAISKNYHSVGQNNEDLDYAKFESRAKALFARRSGGIVDHSLSNLKIFNSDIQGSKATVDLEFNRDWFNLDTFIQQKEVKRRIFTLEKENGLWKITCIEPLGDSEQSGSE